MCCSIPLQFLVSDGQSTTTYAYDSFDQLVRENNQAAGRTWTYAYDDGGNIQSKTEYAYTTGSLGAAVRTVAYGYGDASWSDLLTSIDGQSLTADEIGNLLSDGTWTYTWQHGRQLAGMSKAGTDISYRYDSDGKRITKTVNGTTYNYHYLDDQLVELTWGGNKLHFTYDSTGPLSVNCNGTEYFYVKNAQGDVTGLVSASGTRVVTYTYDAWGNPLATTGSLASTLGEQNPLRYRGYVCDTETGLYYLQSRYYNPEWGRFINADSLIDNRGVHTQNVFAYCGNNPVSREDTKGNISVTLGLALVGGIIGAAISAVSSAVTQYVFTGSVNWKSVGVATVSGFISGAIATSPIGLIGQMIGGGVISAASYVADCYVNKRKVNPGQAVLTTMMGVASGYIGGAGMNKDHVISNANELTDQIIIREGRRANQEAASKAIEAAQRYSNNVTAMAYWSTSFKFSIGIGISNGVVQVCDMLGLFPNGDKAMP